MLSALAAAAINHLLGEADWARQRLIPFAGSRLRVDVAPLAVTLLIGADGRLGPSPTAEAAATTRVWLSPITLMRLVGLHDLSARRAVKAEGDTALGAVLAGIFGELRWEVEEDLSKLIGDIAARRVIRTARGFAGWHAQALWNLAQAAAEYGTEEQPVLASAEAVRAYLQAVDALRDDTERLHKRIERLTHAEATRPRG